ncbi:hypothetical protein B0H17DRAFT_1125575 [Mycena rosella]|uniref:Uncharacterized protein n=1 Tax=Mycena rosella TaxID=1033263 RepID=A0AAD7GWF7_MYCRO|nr:hypothetical protein B0H17DRAFT_1125575 [Mycena rosella]
MPPAIRLFVLVATFKTASEPWLCKGFQVKSQPIGFEICASFKFEVSTTISLLKNHSDPFLRFEIEKEKRVASNTSLMATEEPAVVTGFNHKPRRPHRDRRPPAPQEFNRTTIQIM